jgi:hypothetical protein
VLDEVRDAAQLIEALRGTRLFAEVNFAHDLKCTPALELVVRAHKGDRIGPAPLWLWPLTLSTTILNNEEGVAFTPAGDPNAVFEFSYPTTLVVGVLPLLASPVLITGAVPTWSLMSTGDFHRELQLFLLANADRLESYAHSPPPACKATSFEPSH